MLIEPSTGVQKKPWPKGQNGGGSIFGVDIHQWYHLPHSTRHLHKGPPTLHSNASLHCLSKRHILWLYKRNLFGTEGQGHWLVLSGHLFYLWYGRVWDQKELAVVDYRCRSPDYIGAQQRNHSLFCGVYTRLFAAFCPLSSIFYLLVVFLIKRNRPLWNSCNPTTYSISQPTSFVWMTRPSVFPCPSSDAVS